MRALSLLFALYFITHLASAQTEFQRTFGGKKKENAFQILETSDKGYITTGSTESFGAGKSDIYVVRMDSLGNMLWAKAYGGTNDDFGHYMDKTKDGKYIIIGHSLSFSENYNDIFIMKIDEDGNVIWTKSYGLDKSDYSNSVYSTKDGGFVILGETINLINHEKNSDILVIRADANGNVLWSRIYGGNNTDYAYSIQETPDGGFIVGGETNSYGAGEWDLYLLKLKKDGSVEWSKTYGESKSDYGRFALPTADGGYLIGGNTYNFKSLEIDIFIAKVKSTGDVEWAKLYTGSDTDYLLSMKAYNHEKYLISGYSNSFGLTSENAMVMMINSSGKFLWGKAFGGEGHDYGVSVNVDSRKNIILCGSTTGFGASDDDIYIVKTSHKWKVEECNMTGMYPFNVTNINLKVGTGHYDLDLHCQEVDVTAIMSNTLTAEQILCIDPED